MTPFISIYMELKKFEKNALAEYILSRSNSRVVEYAKLADDKNRAACGLFFCEGIKLACEALKHSTVHDLLVSESFVAHTDCVPEWISDASDRGVRITVLSDPAFAKISTERAPQGVIAIVEFLTDKHTSSGFDDWQSGKRIIMLDEIRDPGNLGTIIRSAEALGVDGVVLSRCVDIYNPKTVRAAMGALFRMPIYMNDDGANISREIKQSGRRLIAATLGKNTVTLGEYDVEKSDCIVIGNEGHGVSREVIDECDMCVRIPMAGECESLNASAAAVCIMWEYYRQIK